MAVIRRSDRWEYDNKHSTSTAISIQVMLAAYRWARRVFTLHLLTVASTEYYHQHHSTVEHFAVHKTNYLRSKEQTKNGIADKNQVQRT